MTTDRDETNVKTFSWVRVGFVVGLFVATIYGLQAWCKYSQRVAAEELTQRIEAESFAVLRAAPTPDELRDAVGDLGNFFSLSEGDWIAIRYQHAHIWPISSSAVAVDSDGNWWVSYEHFCGRIRSFRRHLEEAEDAKMAEERKYCTNNAASFPLLTRLSNASSIESARPILRELGFHAVARP